MTLAPRLRVKHGRFASNPAGAVFGPRRMVDFEFVWMVRGDAAYRWGEVRVDVPEGSVVLCRPGAEDAFAWDPRRRSVHGYVHFDVGTLPRGWPAVGRWPWVRALPEHDVFAPGLRHLLAGLGRVPASHTELTLAHLLSCFVSGETGADAPPAVVYSGPVRAVLGLIEETIRTDPSRPVGLDELAEVAGLHPASLCRRFKRETGRGPAETLRLARLDLALERLTRSSAPVHAVAAEAGFVSPYHFSRAFKAAFGQSPSAVRDGAARGQTPPLARLHRKLPRPESQKSGMEP
jgi:AraC family transcriptional regulator